MTSTGAPSPSASDGLVGRVHRPAELAADVDGYDLVALFEQFPIHRLEVSGGGLSRGRRLGKGAQPLVEAVGGEVDAVPERLVADDDVARNHCNAVLLGYLRRKIGGAVRHNSNRHNCGPVPGLIRPSEIWVMGLARLPTRST